MRNLIEKLKQGTTLILMTFSLYIAGAIFIALSALTYLASIKILEILGIYVSIHFKSGY